MKLLVAITTVNGPERVFAVWRSFQNFPPKTPVEFLIVDDGSDGHHVPITIDYMAKSIGAVVFRHQDPENRPMNLGIPAAWNSACSYAQVNGFSHVLMLNDDVEILSGSVDAAVFFASKNKHVAIVGLPPYAPSPSGLILHWPQSLPKDKPYLALYAMGCSFLLDVETWHQVGEFDARFKSHFEDVDFGLRILEIQKVTAVIPQGVLHGWSKTFASQPHLFGHLRLEVSRHLFHKKWGKTPAEFPIPSCIDDGRTYEYVDLGGQHKIAPLKYARLGAVQE